MGPRFMYSTAGITMRTTASETGQSTDINVWNGTVFAEDDEMARTLTLGCILDMWPMKDGWIRHQSFVLRVPPHQCEGPG